MEFTLELRDTVEKLEAPEAKYEEAFRQTLAVLHDARSFRAEKFFEGKLPPWKKDVANEHCETYQMDLKEGRYTRGCVLLPGNAKDMAQKYFRETPSLPKWNSNYAQCNVIANLGPYMDILQTITEKMFVVSSREMIVGRILRQIEKDVWCCAAKSIHLDDYPVHNTPVRGDVIAAYIYFRPAPEDPENFCTYEFVTCINFKGSIPRSLVHKIGGRLVLHELMNVRAHWYAVAEEAQQGPTDS